MKFLTLRSQSHLWVGTSGYRYWPGDVFPPKTSTDDALRLYSRVLNALELNRTFYQLPRDFSVAKWPTLVPTDFAFAAKIWRRISHEKKLIAIEEDWTLFLKRLTPLLTQKNGVLLLQLPKTFPQEIQPLKNFLARVPQGLRLAVEFRHPFWFRQEIYSLLARYHVALVGVSAPQVPAVLNVQTAPFHYFRLHGPRAWYKDRYSAEELAPFMEAIHKALMNGDVYVFFDNTIGGHAYWNAQEVLMDPKLKPFHRPR